jgi:tetratricopeptide (TPR) repeat protein
MVGLTNLVGAAFSLRGIGVVIACLSILAGIGYGGYAAYLQLATRPIKVCVATDFAFRYGKPGWREQVGGWFTELNRIFQPARIEWQPSFWDDVFTEEVARPLPERRQAMAESMPCRADVVLGLSGTRDPDSNSSVAPFNPALLVAVLPTDSDSMSVGVLSRALAQLFGATTNTATIVSTDSPDAILDARSVKIAEQLRWFPIGGGPSALKGKWEQRAADVIARNVQGQAPNPAMEAHRVLGRAFAAGNLHSNAAAQLQQAINADPRNVGLRLEIALELNLDARMDEALAQLDEASRIEPDDARPRAGRAAILLNTRQHTEGIEELRAAARLDPHNANYQAMLGRMLAPEAGGAEEAREAFTAALRVNPRDGLATWGLSILDAAPEAARDEVAKAQAHVRANPLSSQAMYDLGRAFAARANAAAARQAFLKSVALDPKNAAAHLALAQLHYMSGNLPAAHAALKAGEAAGGKPSAAFVSALNRRLSKP